MLLAIDGVRQEPEQATVSVFDRGFLFGDAIYEVVRTYRRRPFHLPRHLERLARSGDAIGLDVRPLQASLEAEIAEMIAAAPGEEELNVRIMITRGPSPDLSIDTADGPPLRIVWVRPLAPWPMRSLRLISVRADEVVPRVAPGVKSNNRQANVMAHRLARERRCDDALFVNAGGEVTEGPTWNVFCVRGGRVLTPPLDGQILPGITRGLVLESCRELELPTEERALTFGEVQEADEVFVTSTTRGVMSVAALDDVSFSAAPGPVTSRLEAALHEQLERAG